MPKKKKRAARKSSKKQFPWTKVVAFPFKAVWWVGKSLFNLVRTSQQVTQEKVKTRKKTEKRKQLTDRSSHVPFTILESHEGEYGDFETKQHTNKSTIGIILGARGAGKSAIGMRSLENVYHKTGRKVCCIGFQEEKLPVWMNVIKSLEEAGKDAHVLIDEGGVLFNSRESMSEANKILSEAMLVARHNDLSILFISQNSANLEVNTLRQADYLLLKPSSLLQKDFERKKIKEIYDNTESGFKKHKSDPGLTYVYSNEFRGFVSSPLPSFWSTQLSKSFRQK